MGGMGIRIHVFVTHYLVWLSFSGWAYVGSEMTCFLSNLVVFSIFHVLLYTSCLCSFPTLFDYSPSFQIYLVSLPSSHRRNLGALYQPFPVYPLGFSNFESLFAFSEPLPGFGWTFVNAPANLSALLNCFTGSYPRLSPHKQTFCFCSPMSA